MARTDWTREQLLVALYLYCQLPFGQLHSRNPEIVRHADKLGRTPSALAMKLSNIASLDPGITGTGRSGLTGASRADRSMWEEMQQDWEQFVAEAQSVVQSLLPEPQRSESPAPQVSEEYTGPTTTTTVSEARLRQWFFRRAVLSAYHGRCCISGLAMPNLLIASHIVPWSVDPLNRLNPANGLCLSALHDRAFDQGLLSVTDEGTVMVSDHYDPQGDEFYRKSLLDFRGRSISFPAKFLPDPKFLAYHRDHVFLD